MIPPSRQLLVTLVFSVLTVSSAPVWAEDGGAFGEFGMSRRAECLGSEGTLASPLTIKAKKYKKFELLGHRLKEKSADTDDVLRIGVISATKDDREETKAVIKKLIAEFKGKKIDLIVANGDLGQDEFQMEGVFRMLAESGFLVLAMVGNTSSCGSFNRVAQKVFDEHNNFINGNWVRVLELNDGTLFTLPGYYDKRFVHRAGAPQYKDADLDKLKLMIEASPKAKPRILVSHGPPKMKGKKGIDIATGAGHVGDPKMTKLIKESGINFGIFGHILEAGGRGSDLAGKKKRKPKKWYDTLYVNAGTANPDPWRMLGGKTSYGMGMFYAVDKEKKMARFEVFRMKKPKN